MKDRGYLYIEICINEDWVLPEPLLKNPSFRHPRYHKKGEPEYAPQSRYIPGDQSTVNALLKASGERGLPPDISPELMEYYQGASKSLELLNKSWMTLEELIDYIENNPEDEDFYLEPEWFSRHGTPDKVRIIFWFARPLQK